jgi:hypothetical protein
MEGCRLKAGDWRLTEEIGDWGLGISDWGLKKREVGGWRLKGKQMKRGFSGLKPQASSLQPIRSA